MEVQLDIRKFSDWEIGNTDKPFLIAGPCSAETEEQTLKSAHELNRLGIRVFRAGIWKPRTRPNSFEGVGSKGLRWLKKVKKETGMLTTTEVANANRAAASGKRVFFMNASLREWLLKVPPITRREDCQRAKACVGEDLIAKSEHEKREPGSRFPFYVFSPSDWPT